MNENQLRYDLAAWYNKYKRDLPGAIPQTLIKYGSVKLCSSRHRWKP